MRLVHPSHMSKKWAPLMVHVGWHGRSKTGHKPFCKVKENGLLTKDGSDLILGALSNRNKPSRFLDYCKAAFKKNLQLE